MSRSRHLHVNLVGNAINNHPAWSSYERRTGQAPERANPHAELMEMAAHADEGLFTAIFVGDVSGTDASDPVPVFDGGVPEPITALTAVAGVTKHVGLIPTASTTFYDPYTLGRLIGSLDQISDGRAGFNAVTSSDNFAVNYSKPNHPDREARYQIADEFLEAITGLWERRELRKGEDGRTQFFASRIDHKSEHFEIRGPLNVAPSRHGNRPLISQAGGSGPGIRVAAKHADLVFTNFATFQNSISYREELNRALAALGKPADSVPLFPGVVPWLGKTRAEAEEKRRALDDAYDLNSIAPHVFRSFGIEYSYTSLEDSFPTEVLPDPKTSQDKIRGAYGNYVGLYSWIMERPGVTVREVASATLGGWHHRKFVGSYDEFVDDLASWFEGGYADGMNIMPPMGAVSVKEYVDEVVPRLIDRGIHRSTPDSRPLRERVVGTREQ